MRRNELLVMTAALLWGASCAVPPAQLAPQRLTSPRSPADVINTVARTLTAQGFDMDNLDAPAGVLTATRSRGPRGNADFITCKYAKNSINDSRAETTLTVSVVAKPSSGGSDVTVTSRVQAKFPSLQSTVMAEAANDSDCASNGAAERAVSSAIAAQPAGG